MLSNHAVWMWKCDRDIVRFVGYGRFEDMHPALTKWANRFNDDSQLGLWLRENPTEPTRERYGPRLLSKDMALASVMGLRQKHTKTILETRGPSTWDGGGAPKGVYYFNDVTIEKSKIYRSVRAAAREFGVNPSTVTRWCQDASLLSFGYLNEE